MNRCEWCKSDELYIKYHDEQWGVPVHDDRVHSEFLILEAAQAGLSWITILRKRDNFKKALDGFDPQKIAEYGEDKINELMADPGIIRNRRKIDAFINNSARFLEIQKEFVSFDSYIWGFVDNKPVINSIKSISEVPATSPLSDHISRELKKRGFKFMGSTIVYSYLQAVGIIDDHVNSCFRKSDKVV